MEAPSLRDVFWAHPGLLSDKWEHYLPIYEAELRPYLEHGASITLLEIGVHNGGSLEVWRKLLPPKSRVIGIDINERCRELTLSDGIELHIGDATQPDFVDSALGDTRFDIIIDDGSHRSHDIIASFEILFGRLNSGGLYIAEDLHCSYWPAYGGGFRAAGSAIEWAKDLVDAVNVDHLENSSALGSKEFARLSAFNTQIARIAFFDSVLVVQKYAAPKERPFARVLAGAECPILDPLDWIPKMPTNQLGNVIVNPAMAQHLDIGFKKRLRDKDRELRQQQRAFLRQQQQLEHQERRLERLQMSASWRITAPLRYTKILLEAVGRRFATLIGRR